MLFKLPEMSMDLHMKMAAGDLFYRGFLSSGNRLILEADLNYLHGHMDETIPSDVGNMMEYYSYMESVQNRCRKVQRLLGRRGDEP